MNHAIDLLTTQHREVEELFSTIETAPDLEKKIELFELLADQLAIHTAIEEHHFYPAVKAKETKDLLVESLEEHLAVKRSLSDLLEGNFDETTFNVRIQMLKEQVEHHVEEEEKELFPKVRKSLDSNELISIGERMRMEQEDLEKMGEPRLSVPLEIGESAQV
jgi:hemerythrin superfamily protein